MLPELDELFIYCTTSKVTSDFLVDLLESWWENNCDRFTQSETLILNQDNGAENHSRRTQFRKRMEVLSGQLATTAIDAVMVVFYALLMFQDDSVLTAVVVSLATVNVLALILIARQRIDTNQRLINEYGKAEATEMAGLQNIETFKASGTESNFFTRWVGQYSKAIAFCYLYFNFFSNLFLTSFY